MAREEKIKEIMKIILEYEWSISDGYKFYGGGTKIEFDENGECAPISDERIEREFNYILPNNQKGAIRQMAEEILDKVGNRWITICTARPSAIYNFN